MWPDADIFTAVYDEEGTEGRFAGRSVHTSFLQTPAPVGARCSAPCCRSTLPRSSRSTCRSTTSSSRARPLGRMRVLCDEQHDPRQLLPQPVPLRVERPRADAGPQPQRAAAGISARRLQTLAPVGLDRRPAYGPLHRQLAHHPGPDPRLLRRARRTSSTRRLTLSASPAATVGRPLRGRLRADAPQADRCRDRRVQHPRSPLVVVGRRARRAAAAATRRRDDPVRRQADRRGRRRHPAERARADRHGGRGVRDRGRRIASGGTAGDRSTRWRRARDRPRRRHRALLVRRLA